MEFHAFQGFYPEEQILDWKYSVDLELTLDATHAALNDELQGTINYEIVYKIVRREMEINSKLIEHVANRILTSLKAEFKQLQHAKIWKHKTIFRFFMTIVWTKLTHCFNKCPPIISFNVD